MIGNINNYIIYFFNKYFKKIKITGKCGHGYNVTKISETSKFAQNIQNIISEIKPRRIIETGTYLGTGTTQIIAEAIQKNNINNCVFYSIEVNPQYYKEAFENLSNRNLVKYVTLLNGLSIPRDLLPSRKEIEDQCLRHINFNNIFVDHEESDRVELYYKETNFKDVPDNLLELCLRRFNYQPDFILLDSAGHIGYLEFNYTITKLKKQCYIVLDDIYHIKHHNNFLQIREDPRFELIISSKEKFGFCIAIFTPKDN